MTEVMNFFQAMFMFKNFAPMSATKQEVKLAIDLKCEAEQLAAKADEEMRNGRTTQGLAFAANDKEKIRIFTEIAVWHNGRAAEKYRQSAERFAEAGKIYTKKSKAFNIKVKEMTRRRAEAEAAVNLFKQFSKTKLKIKENKKMKIQNKLNALFIATVAVALCLACSGSSGADQQTEANKIVDQANKKLDDAKELYVKTETRNTALFSPNIQTLQQLFAYKAKMGGEAKSIVSDYEKVVEMMKDVSKQYDDISRMNLNEKYKDYAKLKSDEFAKRAEAITVRKGNAQAFNEIDDPRTMTAKFDENNQKSDRLFKDAEDIAAKAKKIEEDNKEIFKQS